MDVLHGLGINPQSQSYRASLLEIPAGSCPAKPSSSQERSAIRGITLNSLSPPTGKSHRSHLQIHLLPPGRQRRRLQAGQGPQTGRARHFRGRLLQNDRELIAAKQQKREAGTETHASCARLPVSSYSLLLFPVRRFPEISFLNPAKKLATGSHLSPNKPVC